MSAWRLFVAAPVPAEAAARVWHGLAETRARHGEVRWIQPEQMHLTLLFLGATDPPDVARIVRVTTATARIHGPAVVETADVGGRAGGRRGGVCWLRLKGPGVEAMTRLSRDLDDALAGARRGDIHAPHLTVARGISEDVLADVPPLRVHFTVERIAVLRSHTGSRGATYEQLALQPLTGPAVDAAPPHP